MITFITFITKQNDSLDEIELTVKYDGFVKYSTTIHFKRNLYFMNSIIRANFQDLCDNPPQ